jgi:hypothetical protein
MAGRSSSGADLFGWDSEPEGSVEADPDNTSVCLGKNAALMSPVPTKNSSVGH